MTHEANALFKETFGREPEFIAEAPGRLEFIGNHTDYNGGPVMGVAVDRVISVALARTETEEAQLVTAGASDVVTVDLKITEPLVGQNSWVNYPVGVYKVLCAAGMQAEGGFQLAVSSTLPPGAGMSSSAALELASAYAYSAAYGFKAEPAELAKLCRQAENTFVGVPCGLLDQGVSAFGKRDRIVTIDCQTEEFGRVPLPSGVHFWVFNTQVKHALVDSLYETRHQECMEVLSTLRKAYPELSYLAEASLSQLDSVSGELSDDLLARARHVITECMRVREMSATLEEGDLVKMGNLLLASHQSSRMNFENSCAELDTLVDNLKRVDGVYGCRLTGGGFGGAVMAVTDSGFGLSQAEKVCETYSVLHGHEPTIFHTLTGDGARLIEPS
ncbi:MAG: galactokinase [Verrucomicrobiota bacterium]